MTASQHALPRKPVKISIGMILIYLALILALLFYLMPVYIMVANGFKESANVSLSTMWALPNSLQGGGFAEAAEDCGRT